MSKEERYAHLGEGETPTERPTDADSDAETDADPEANADADAGADAVGCASGIRVTIDDGDEELTLRVDPDAASVADLRDAVSRTSEDTSPAPMVAGVRSMLAAQRLALDVGLTGTVVAMEQASSVPFRYNSR